MTSISTGKGVWVEVDGFSIRLTNTSHEQTTLGDKVNSEEKVLIFNILKSAAVRVAKIIQDSEGVE